jgi:universal stress protein A
MSIIDHVICPVDLSPSTRPLLSHAAAWARWNDAELHALHVVPLPALLGDPIGGMVIAAPAQSAQEVRAEFARLVSDLPLGDVSPSFDVIEGALVETILEEARRRPHSMLIMGTHGRTGLDRIVHGSVAASVTHHAPCAVLVLPPRQSDDTEHVPPFTRILCAVDFLPSSLAGLEHALRLAERTGAHLELVHVVETAGAPEAGDEALKRLRQHIPEGARQWCTVHERVLTGPPAQALLRVAEESLPDLIVMGTGDRFHLRSMWLGGATDRLMRSAHAPILIVPAPPAGAAPQERVEYA